MSRLDKSMKLRMEDILALQKRFISIFERQSDRGLGFFPSWFTS